MSGHEAKSRSAWYQGEDIEKVKKETKKEQRIETLLHQVTIGVTVLEKQIRRLKETKA